MPRLHGYWNRHDDGRLRDVTLLESPGEALSPASGGDTAPRRRELRFQCEPDHALAVVVDRDGQKETDPFRLDRATAEILRDRLDEYLRQTAPAGSVTRPA